MKPIIYQLVVRYFGNINLTNQFNGPLASNGCGKFNDINTQALKAIKDLGVTHVWLTGVLRQATLTDYPANGLPADDPDIVKGLAGSFYAVRDYFDVCPDYAVDVSKRLSEFEALTARIHAAGLSILIDFVPNHVSRGYGSVVNPEHGLGKGDAQTSFYSNDNNFFYLVDPPGQSLQLSKPAGWNPAGVQFDGRFAPEDGSPGRVPKATGNNGTSPAPVVGDWYETIKLNYGYNFAARAGVYSPAPKTWADTDEILAYWQSKGVDGFRCDFAHYVPAEAWSYLISRAKQRQPAFFFAEAYPYQHSGDPVENQQELLDAGFDALYFFQSYNALKGVYANGDLAAYDSELLSHDVQIRSTLVTYLENHDELRVAACFGSADAGYQLAPLQFLYSSGASMLLNGQEVGEPGAGAAGFSGDDGRTTIYDYWAMPEFAKWVNNHRYDGGGLSGAQTDLRKFYAALLQLCQDKSVQGDGFWGLRYFNPGELYSYARFQSNSGAALVVVANFQPNTALTGQIRLPGSLCEAAGLTGTASVTLVLNRQGAVNEAVASLPAGDLTMDGFAVSIPNQTAQVYRVTA